MHDHNLDCYFCHRLEAIEASPPLHRGSSVKDAKDLQATDIGALFMQSRKRGQVKRSVVELEDRSNGGAAASMARMIFSNHERQVEIGSTSSTLGRNHFLSIMPKLGGGLESSFLIGWRLSGDMVMAPFS